MSENWNIKVIRKYTVKCRRTEIVSWQKYQSYNNNNKNTTGVGGKVEWWNKGGICWYRPDHTRQLHSMPHKPCHIYVGKNQIHREYYIYFYLFPPWVSGILLDSFIHSRIELGGSLGRFGLMHHSHLDPTYICGIHMAINRSFGCSGFGVKSEPRWQNWANSKQIGPQGPTVQGPIYQEPLSPCNWARSPIPASHDEALTLVRSRGLAALPLHQIGEMVQGGPTSLPRMTTKYPLRRRSYFDPLQRRKIWIWP